jgi:hypothetical protein
VDWVGWWEQYTVTSASALYKKYSVHWFSTLQPELERFALGAPVALLG